MLQKLVLITDMVCYIAGECVGSLSAHQDAVSCISIDASGLYLASGGAVARTLVYFLKSF